MSVLNTSWVPAAVAAAVLATAAPVTQAAGPEGWGEWQAGGSGYIARRKEPPRMAMPSSKRRAASVAPQRALLERGSDSAMRRVAGVANADMTIASVEPPRALFLQTPDAGLYRVSVAELAQHFGRTELQVRRRALRGGLRFATAATTQSETPDKTVSWYYDAPTDSVLFAADAYRSFYTDENATQLRLGTGRPGESAPMPTVTAGAALPGSDQSFADSILFEEEPDMSFATWVVADEPEADYWFWDFLLVGSREEIALELYVPDPAATGTATVQVLLRGFTDLQPGDDHLVAAELNGQPLGSVSWGGLEEAVLEATIDQSFLDPGGNNQLVLRTSAPAGGSPGQFLDSVQVDYVRLPVAVDDQLVLRNSAGGRQRVSGLSSPDVRVIQSPFEDASIMSDPLIEPSPDGRYSVSFDTENGANYLVTTDAAVPSPRISEDRSPNLSRARNEARYLVIAPREFAATASAVATLREASYGSAMVVWVDDIYARYSAGRSEPIALARFMQDAQQKWRVPPEQVLLLGKGSLDQKDRMGFADSFVPIRMTANPWALAPSDTRLLGYEDFAPFAVARLPLVNDAEGLAYVQKLQSYEQSQGLAEERAVLVADNPDDGGDFPANVAELAGQLTTDYGFEQTTVLRHPADSVAGALAASASWETNLVHYAGHGSTQQIGNSSENFLTNDAAAALGNEQLPLFTALTCAVGDDSMPGMRSLAGSLVLNPAGGAIAAFVPTGLSLDAEAVVLAQPFLDASYLESLSLGDAVREAKARSAGQISAFMPRVYTLVGEPGVSAR